MKEDLDLKSLMELKQLIEKKTLAYDNLVVCVERFLLDTKNTHRNKCIVAKVMTENYPESKNNLTIAEYECQKGLYFYTGEFISTVSSTGGGEGRH